jgi:hypothetical protein
MWGAIRAEVRSVRQWKWLHAAPLANHPVRIYDVAFAREFNDRNDIQLAVAQAIGVPAVENREAAERMKKRLVEISDNDLYSVDDLTHSIPFLVPQAAELLERIGRNFQDSLSSKGLNPNKLVVTSVLRTLEDVQLLLRPVRLAGGFVVLPEFADLVIVPCVFRAIVFHYFRSCK